jgi:hypothetical protein
MDCLVEDLIVAVSRQSLVGFLLFVKAETHSGQEVRKEEFVGNTWGYLNRSPKKRGRLISANDPH